MKYLVDTDVVIAYLRNRPEARAFVAAHGADELAISLIAYGEVYEGLYFGANQRRYEQGFALFLRGVRVLPLNRPIMKRFARLRGQLRQAGTLIGDADTLISVTALHHNLALVTGNVRQFNRVPNLALLTPWSH